MTVAANSRRKEYDGNGVATVFTGPMAHEKQHVFAYLTIDGVKYPLALDTDYTVARLGQESGTRVTFVVAPPAEAGITLLRTMPYTQEVDVTNQGAFHAETIENGFDALAMQIQQLSDGSLQLVYDPNEGAFIWDAQGNRIVRVGDAIGLTDAMNMRSVLTLIEAINSGGGSTGVQPKLFQFSGDGVQADFFMPGADIAEPSMYDTYIEGTVSGRDFVGCEPGIDFTVELGTDDVLGPGAWMHFATPLADGVNAFAVFRGYARPYIGDLPITTLDLKVFDIVAATATLDAPTMKWGLGRCSNMAGCVVTIPAINPLDNDRFKTGSFVSLKQQGFGQVEVVAGDGVVLDVPELCLAKTRAARSIISVVCEDADSNLWVLAGDLARS